MSEGEQTTQTQGEGSTDGEGAAAASEENSTGTSATTEEQGTGTGEGTGEGQAAEGTGQDQGSESGKEGDGTGGDNDQSEGAPENYEAFNLPDGYSLEGERLDAVTEFAKANDWTQEKAQEAVDLYLSMQQQDIAKQDQAYVDLQAEWQNALKDNSYMTDGEGFEANVAKVNKGVNIMQEMLNSDMKDDAPVLADMLKETGMGNHPAVNFMFKALENHLGEDGFVGSKGPTGQQRSIEDRWYKSEE
ncbi:MAG: hypothetical protein N0E44_18915 [Candidatus Thiodiazotropha lotti]|nr:hypothetical protein [Candidatus Thiodiazotropha lotti]MCW4221957.1 hypothetical protein [Candidatus Thiodiazotropha lotti]